MPLAKSFSTSSRSTGRSPSIASYSSRSQGSANYESTARTYYIELKKYLAAFLRKEAIEGVHPQRASARQKLSRLSNLQFHELAMDVYDELMRRNLNDRFVPFLSVREEFHPKRNQARQKLATLSEERFMDLASDVYFELVRRYPHIMDPDDESRPPMPVMPMPSKSNGLPSPPPAGPPPSQSTTIIPTKGTINVESLSTKDFSDDDDDSHYSRDSPGTNGFHPHSPPSSHAPPRQRQASLSSNRNPHYQSNNSKQPYQGMKSNKHEEEESLDTLMADLGNMVSRSDDPRQRDQDQRLVSMTKRIQQLEKENQELLTNKASYDPGEGEREMTSMKNRLNQLQDEYNRLDELYRKLERDHHDQQEMVQTVKQETTDLMKELSKLSKENDQLKGDKDSAERQIKDLRKEVGDWEAKYQHAKIELRQVKGADDKDLPRQDFIKENHLQPSRSGAISYDSVLRYQGGLEDLLRSIRTKSPTDVLNTVRSVVLVCKSMTEDVEHCEARGILPSDKQAKVLALKKPFSNGLAHLVAVTKTHINSMGLSPVMLVDVAASHLTATVIDLVKLLGMNPDLRGAPPSPSTASATSTSPVKTSTPNVATITKALLPSTLEESDLDSDDDNQPIRHMKQTRQPSPIDPHDDDAMSPTQLASYLKGETDQIVQNVQRLLGALRSPQRSSEVYGIITKIVEVVTTVNEASRSTFSNSSTGAGLRYRQQGETILSDLKRCQDKLIYIRNESFDRSPETASSSAKRDLAKESYEIAKYIKELISLCEA
ncbi:hypothetical protein DM01DRAFT_1337123 [Hesseltinella vesiculosa]|uniref:GIT Spa2 homology (SHD) domain-containing protein n=1 Tax=Hesseltinella vesiculosa TaxID=101127 RepID=A0A1X2GEZ1_9FUNG|nr:hypothetical protein DM01DRAFT_1337123 [Hesseltinella vesiculosa]